MTGYHISIGYQSGSVSKDEAWEVLKRVTLNICRYPHYLIDEAVRLGMQPKEAHEYAAAYASASVENAGTEDSTLRIIEGERAEGNPQIMMLAGGSGESRESRTIKEAMRRAFCRRVMYEMHKHKIEININVA